MPINKNIISSTIGENDGISQLFIQNNIVNIKDAYVYPKLFEIPLFCLFNLYRFTYLFINNPFKEYNL